MSQKKETQQALAPTTPTPYKIFITDPNDVVEMVQDNLEGRELRLNKLVKYTVPGGGALQFNVESPEGEEDPVNSVEGIIVGYRDMRQYHKLSYEETGGNSPADCQSFDMVTGRGDPGGECASCPLNEFKSKGAGKACREYSLIFLVTPDDLFPHVVKVPPASMGKFEGMLVQLISKHGAAYHRAVVRISLTKEKGKVSKIPYAAVKMEFIRALTKDESALFASYRQALYTQLTGKKLKQLAEPANGAPPPQVEGQVTVPPTTPQADPIAEDAAAAL